MTAPLCSICLKCPHSHGLPPPLVNSLIKNHLGIDTPPLRGHQPHAANGTRLFFNNIQFWRRPPCAGLLRLPAASSPAKPAPGRLCQRPRLLNYPCESPRIGRRHDSAPTSSRLILHALPYSVARLWKCHTSNDFAAGHARRQARLFAAPGRLPWPEARTVYTRRPW
jgi:hypothetical protein